jgi:hypothetical protein
MSRLFNIPELVEGRRVRKTQPYVFPGVVDLPISAAALDVPADAFNNVLNEPVFIGRVRFAAVALNSSKVELTTPAQDDMLRFLSIEFKLGQTDEQLSKTRIRISTLINDDEPHWDVRETPLYIPARSTFNARVTNHADGTIFAGTYAFTRLFVTLDGVRVYLE